MSLLILVICHVAAMVIGALEIHKQTKYDLITLMVAPCIKRFRGFIQKGIEIQMVVLPDLSCLGRGYLLKLALLLTFLILCFSLQIRNVTRNALSCYFHHSAISLSGNLRQWRWEVMSWIKSEIWFLALEGYRCGFCLNHQFRSWCWKVMALTRILEMRYRISIQLLANFTQ